MKHPTEKLIDQLVDLVEVDYYRGDQIRPFNEYLLQLEANGEFVKGTDIETLKEEYEKFIRPFFVTKETEING